MGREFQICKMRAGGIQEGLGRSKGSWETLDLGGSELGLTRCPGAEGGRHCSSVSHSLALPTPHHGCFWVQARSVQLASRTTQSTAPLCDLG